MEKQQQIKSLRKLANKYNIPEDLYDWEAMFDSTLNYEENKAIMEEDIKILASSNSVEEKVKVDFKTGAKTITQEKEEVEKVKLQQMNEEIEHTEEEFKKSLELISKEKSSLDKYFVKLSEAIKSVINSNNNLNSLFVCSRGGLGKTTTTLKTIQREKVEFVYISSYSTPVEMVNYIYKNRDKTIVFDDFENIWDMGVKGINILKACLWGIGKDNKRLVTYLTTDKRLTAPQQFEFSGKMIFLLNKMPKVMDNLTKALLSRALVYELNFTYQETMTLLAEFTKNRYNTLKREERNDIFSFLKENTDESCLSDLNFRTLIKLYDLYINNNTNWKELSSLVFQRDEKLFVLKQFIQSSQTLKEAKTKFYEAGFGGERTFQRTNKQLKQLTTERH